MKDRPSIAKLVRLAQRVTKESPEKLKVILELADLFLNIQIDSEEEERAEFCMDFFTEGLIAELYLLIPHPEHIDEEEDQFLRPDFKELESNHFLTSSVLEDISESAKEDAIARFFYHYKRFFESAVKELNFYEKNLTEEENDDRIRDSLISDNLVVNLFINMKLHLLDEFFDKVIDRLVVSNKWSIRDPDKLLNKIIDNYELALKPELMIQPLYHMIICGYTIECSKRTSDRYVQEVVKLLNTKLKVQGGHRELPIPDLSLLKSENDDRIDTGLDQQLIVKYFMQLTKQNGDGKYYLPPEEIGDFLRANFVGFDPQTERKILNPNLKKGMLGRFIYEFYYHVDANIYRGKKSQYCQLLIKNFKRFESDTEDKVANKLSTYDGQNYPFHYKND